MRLLYKNRDIKDLNQLKRQISTIFEGELSNSCYYVSKTLQKQALQYSQIEVKAEE